MGPSSPFAAAVVPPPDSFPPHAPSDGAASAERAEANGRAALRLLHSLMGCGLRHGVVCPGSRSAPLAVAAALLEARGLVLHTALDERSAAFLALGLGAAEGVPAAVITTSGSAVAHLLPACVEADHGAIPMLLLSADRPARLKGCGANQSVNQETFLHGSCRWFGQGAATGLASQDGAALDALAREAYRWSVGSCGPLPAGPVHLNLPFEEPLHPDAAALAALAAAAALNAGAGATARSTGVPFSPSPLPAAFLPRLDPDRPGVVVAGPWRGSPARWPGHLQALIRWQRRSGWPVLADPLSGLWGQPGLALVAGYDLLLEAPESALAAPQVLRLGSLPASRRLERWLESLRADQVLVSEGDPRPLDPLRLVRAQFPLGLEAWLAALALSGADDQVLLTAAPSPSSGDLAHAWQQAVARLQALLERQLAPAATSEASISEPALARQLSRLLPPELPLMLANSSPVRDWACFADPAAAFRPVFGFRGASGIDGTLSEACGIAEALGACLLLSGDLALLHDANGWLWRPQLRGRLTVVVIDNGGGGIFEQLPIRTERSDLVDFERLFVMPQPLDPLLLAHAHGVPARRVASAVSLPSDLAWALAQPFSLLVVRTDRRHDAELRRRLLTMAALDAAS
jgi:2-succinyl-5-enolpyruvyl-6-hydroxy-3-cyclohexene-1-carboxylate synthase